MTKRMLQSDILTRTTENTIVGDIAYDYNLQCWAAYDGSSWIIRECGHGDNYDESCCGCHYSGESIEMATSEYYWNREVSILRNNFQSF